MTELEINGKKRELGDDTSVASMLEQLGVRNPLVIVELNGEVVTKADFEATKLSSGDRVEIITLMGGG